MPSNVSMFDQAGLTRATAVQNEGVEAGRAQMRQLLAQADQLASTWTGGAADKFQEGLATLKTNGDRLFAVLEEMASMTDGTNKIFMETHETTTQRSSEMAQHMASAAPTGLPGL